MFFNGNEKYEMMKLHQEETERKFQQEWRWDLPKTETLLQKVIKRWKKSEKASLVQTNCCYECSC